MGGPGKAHHENTEKLQDRPLLFGGCYFSQLYDRKFENCREEVYAGETTTNIPTAGAMLGQERRNDREESDSATNRGKFSMLRVKTDLTMQKTPQSYKIWCSESW